MAEGPFRRQGSDLLVAFRLTPRADRDALEGRKTLADGRTVLSVRVRAIPESGRANDALIALVAGLTGLKRSAITVESGATARLKVLRLSGAGPDAQAALGGTGEA